MRRMLGFTLIELLIVIAVIAILVGITVPRFLGMRDEANMAKAAGEVSALKAAVEAYRIHKDFFPKESITVTQDWQSELVAMRPKLIESELDDPFEPGAEYRYATSAASDSEYYVIFSMGPDRLADISGIGTDGVIDLVSGGNATEDVFATNGTAP